MTKFVEGPVPGEYGGLVCITKTKRCKHLAYHDWNYPYCAAQPVEGQAYPWPGAGVRLYREVPNAGCPFVAQGENP